MKNLPTFEDFVNHKSDFEVKVTTITQTQKINESDIYEDTQVIKNSSKNDVDEKQTYVQWMQIGTASYLPGTYSVGTLKPGVYTVEQSMQGTFCKKVNLNTDDIIPLPNPIYKEIIENVSDFFTKEEDYKKAGYNHKRGILMYGRPGNGKSFVINHLIHHLIEKENVVALYFPKYAETFEDFIYNLKEIEPKRKVMVIMEDLDGLMQMEMNKSAILNLLDGIKQINNICFVATTNYPERLEENIINRPSRFDKKYELQDPSEEDRRVYFKYKILDEYKDMYDMDKLVKDTEGLSMSHLKELLITLYVYKWDYDKCIEQLKKMSEVKQPEFKDEVSGNGMITKSIGCYESNFINLEGYEINEIDKNQLTYPELKIIENTMKNLPKLNEFLSSYNKINEDNQMVVDSITSAFDKYSIEYKERGDTILFKLGGKPHKVEIREDGSLSVSGNVFSFKGDLQSFINKLEEMEAKAKFNPLEWFENFANENKISIGKPVQNKYSKNEYSYTFEYNGIYVKAKPMESRIFLSTQVDRNSVTYNYNAAEVLSGLKECVDYVDKYYTLSVNALKMVTTEFEKRGYSIYPPDNKTKKAREEHFGQLYVNPDINNLCAMVDIDGSNYALTTDMWNCQGVRFGVEGNKNSIFDYIHRETDAVEMVDSILSAMEKFTKGPVKIIEDYLMTLQKNRKFKVDLVEQKLDYGRGTVKAAIIDYNNSRLVIQYFDEGAYYKADQSYYEPDILDSEKDIPAFRRTDRKINIPESSGGTWIMNNVKSIENLVNKYLIIPSDNLLRLEGIKKKLKPGSGKLILYYAMRNGDFYPRLDWYTEDKDNIYSVISESGNGNIERTGKYSKNYIFVGGKYIKNISDKEFLSKFQDHIDDIEEGF